MSQFKDIKIYSQGSQKHMSCHSKLVFFSTVFQKMAKEVDEIEQLHFSVNE